MTPDPRRPTPILSYVAGPLLGAAAGMLWGVGGAGWILASTFIGTAAALIAGRLSDRELSPAARVATYFLAFLAGLSIVPFCATSGLLPMRRAALDELDPAIFLLLPLFAAIATAAHTAFRASAPERRTRGARQPRIEMIRWVWTLAGLAGLTLIAVLDGRLPSPYSLDYLYVAPVLLITWQAGPQAGTLLAILAAQARGIARGLAFTGELSPAFIALDMAVAAAGLVVAVALLSGVWRALEGARRAARTDPLTGLANRMHFLERVEQEVRRVHGPVSIAYLDLDGFKAVNDTRGHAVGDEVLRIVAGALSTTLRSEDLAARFGGDEFAILLPGSGPDVAPRVAERVRAEIEDRMSAFDWSVTCSVGMITALGAQHSTPDLLRHADELMYEVKREGKNAMKQMVLA